MKEETYPLQQQVSQLDHHLQYSTNLVMMHKYLKITRKYQAFKSGKNKPLHSQSHGLMARKQAGKLIYTTKGTMTISYS